MDLYSAHRTERVLAALRSRGWTVFFVPGGCTGKVQVHDTHVNKAFKADVQQQWAKYCTDSKGKGKVTRAIVTEFVAGAWARLDPTLIGRGLDDNVFTHILNCVTKENADEPIHEQPLPPEEGNLAAAFECMNLAEEPPGVDEQVAAEEALLQEDREVLTCCFCLAPKDLRKCTEPRCDQHFHHFCSIEINGEDSSNTCKYHAY